MFRKLVRASDYMQSNPVVVQPDTDLFDAIAEILKHKISGLTVLDAQNKPVGILSELDCLEAILSVSYYREQGTLRVKDYMVSPVQSIAANGNIMDISRSMLDDKRRRYPVVDESGVMIGQVTCRQLLKAIRDMDMPDRVPD